MALLQTGMRMFSGEELNDSCGRQVFHVSRNITRAEMTTLCSQPIEIVPNPGEAKIILAMGGSFQFIPGEINFINSRTYGVGGFVPTLNGLDGSLVLTFGTDGTLDNADLTGEKFLPATPVWGSQTTYQIAGSPLLLCSPLHAGPAPAWSMTPTEGDLGNGLYAVGDTGHNTDNTFWFSIESLVDGGAPYGLVDTVAIHTAGTLYAVGTEVVTDNDEIYTVDTITNTTHIGAITGVAVTNGGTGFAVDDHVAIAAVTAGDDGVVIKIDSISGGGGTGPATAASVVTQDGKFAAGAYTPDVITGTGTGLHVTLTVASTTTVGTPSAVSWVESSTKGFGGTALSTTLDNVGDSGTGLTLDVTVTEDMTLGDPYGIAIVFAPSVDDDNYSTVMDTGLGEDLVLDALYDRTKAGDHGLYGPIASAVIRIPGDDYNVGDTGTVGGNSGEDHATYVVTSIWEGGYGYAMGDTGTLSADTGEGVTYVVTAVGEAGKLVDFDLTADEESLVAYLADAGAWFTPGGEQAGSGNSATIMVDFVDEAGVPTDWHFILGSVTGVEIDDAGLSYKDANNAATVAAGEQAGEGENMTLDIRVSLASTGRGKVDVIYAVVDMIEP